MHERLSQTMMMISNTRTDMSSQLVDYGKARLLAPDSGCCVCFGRCGERSRTMVGTIESTKAQTPGWIPGIQSSTRCFCPCPSRAFKPQSFRHKHPLLRHTCHLLLESMPLSSPLRIVIAFSVVVSCVL